MTSVIAMEMDPACWRLELYTTELQMWDLTCSVPIGQSSLGSFLLLALLALLSLLGLLAVAAAALSC